VYTQFFVAVTVMCDALCHVQIHLSFSLSGGSGPKAPGQETPHFMNVLLQSLGVTLTDVQDVVFK
jgi:vacuolar protein sorting-associated protein 13A/C